MDKFADVFQICFLHCHGLTPLARLENIVALVETVKNFA
jgi:hypothetical protein